MDFHAEFFPKGFPKKIEHWQKLLLIGSCFTEQIGTKLANHKFDILQNPNGILFNPVSIAQAISGYVHNKVYTADDLFYHNDIWGSWQHHTRFSGIGQQQVLEEINDSQKNAGRILKNANWLLVTLGSAFVYERTGAENTHYGNVVANCHKIPPDKFRRRLLDPAEITAVLQEMIDEVIAFNPGMHFIFTISPVRHLREGFIENNRSKAALIQAVHALTNELNVFYFPAYELVIDDLRDYRFYAEDMVHPNYTATNYVWEKFIPACIDDKAQQLMKEINEINAAVSHRPFNPKSAAHAKFVNNIFDKIAGLQKRHNYLDFDKEIAVLKEQLT
jgi:hypothetical protein